MMNPITRRVETSTSPIQTGDRDDRPATSSKTEASVGEKDGRPTTIAPPIIPVSSPIEDASKTSVGDISILAARTNP